MYFLRIFLLIIFLSTQACRHKATEAAPENKNCITDTLASRITLDTVKMQHVQKVLSLTGTVEANEDQLVKVYPVVSGIVEEMNVQLGDYVKKGQVLSVIRSSEIAGLQSEYSYAESAVQTAEKTVLASRQMLDAGLATDRELANAQNDLNKANADLKRIRETTGIFGVRDNARQRIVAPVSGYVIGKTVTDKMQYRVDGAQPFFTIANLDELWVMASVFESDIAQIKVGYEAEISIMAYKDRQIRGKVDRIFSILDPESRVMRVRIRIPNPDNLLKPEMFAQVKIRYDEGSNELPSIPSASVIFNQNKNYVMVYKDKCSIETREVEVYQPTGDRTYIRSGLKPGELVISSYQLLIYDALND